MTDAEYNEQKERLEKYLVKWHKLMSMGHYHLKYVYKRDFCVDDKSRSTYARTSTSWEYREATIEWYMPSLAKATDDELENIVIHEFCHVQMAPLSQDQPEVMHEQRELATENFTRILLSMVKGDQVVMKSDEEPLIDGDK